MHSENSSFMTEGDIKTFYDKQKPKEFKNTTAALQKIFKGILQTEEEYK
jgi:hypothetical protein